MIGIVIWVVVAILCLLGAGFWCGWMARGDALHAPPPNHPVHRRAPGSHPYVQDAYDRWLIDITETGPERLATTGELGRLYPVQPANGLDPRLAKYIGEEG